jgi:menaquinone-dependent protoporphyrinogen IX oxidase
VNKTFLFLFVALLLPCPPSFAQPDSSMTSPITPRNILIAKGDSYLENTVAAMIVDSLSTSGTTVTIIPLNDLNKQNRLDYTVVVLFNAVKRGQINSAVNKYIKTTENYGTLSNLLICNVLGEKWKGKEASMDAVTTATKTLNPEPVASRVLANIRSVLQREQ